MSPLGGTLEHDLFDEENEGYLADRALLDRLVAERSTSLGVTPCSCLPEMNHLRCRTPRVTQTNLKLARPGAGRVVPAGRGGDRTVTS
jgi:hypothetical protein